MKDMRELKQAMSICTTAVSQFTALAALDGPTTWLDDRRSTFASTLARTTAALATAGIHFIPPDAYPCCRRSELNASHSRRLAPHGCPLPPAAAGEVGPAGVRRQYARLDLSSLTGEARP